MEDRGRPCRHLLPMTPGYRALDRVGKNDGRQEPELAPGAKPILLLRGRGPMLDTCPSLSLRTEISRLEVPTRCSPARTGQAPFLSAWGLSSYRLMVRVARKSGRRGIQTKKVRDVMRTEVHKVGENADQRDVAHLFVQHGIQAIPVVDAAGRMKGIITADDIADAIREEATSDIQKVGGMEALDGPYLETGFLAMLRKRAGWLVILFLGEMLTATAMTHYEEEIERAVVLALFIPLLISSGGNSGSQATTLVIRAMALGELRLRDWWRVIRREVLAGMALGLLLGSIGFLRIVIWQAIAHSYGEHYLLVALTIAFSLLGVVTFGTLAGSMLPFILRRCGLDPASASAPFVATLVDVTGLIIYFSVAKWILTGVLL